MTNWHRLFISKSNHRVHLLCHGRLDIRTPVSGNVSEQLAHGSILTVDQFESGAVGLRLQFSVTGARRLNLTIREADAARVQFPGWLSI